MSTAKQTYNVTIIAPKPRTYMDITELRISDGVLTFRAEDDICIATGINNAIVQIVTQDIRGDDQ